MEALALGGVCWLESRLMNLPTITQAIVSVSVVVLASCASGPTYAEMKPKLPPIPKGQGRVFVYRTSSFGAAIRPQVRIDGNAIGKSTAKGFLYSDQPAGSHEISMTTEWKHKNTVQVTPGLPSFVSTTVTPGVFAGHMIPNPVDTATGESEIRDCKLVEP